MLIQKQIDNCFFCGIYSYDAFARSVIIFLNAIPEIEEDEQFRDEVRKATIKVRYGTGRWRGFGGQTREIMDEYDDFDHFKIFRAIINCLRRRGLYSVPKLWNESQHELYWTHSVIDRIKNGSPSGADSALAKEEPVKFPELPNEAQKKDEKEVNGA
jgi:hypothetical protein